MATKKKGAIIRLEDNISVGLEILEDIINDQTGRTSNRSRIINILIGQVLNDKSQRIKLLELMDKDYKELINSLYELPNESIIKIDKLKEEMKR